MRKSRGFTLIEILLVLSIISVMLIGSFRIAQQKAQQALIQQVAQKVQTVENAAMTYFIAKNAWPGDPSNPNNAVTQNALINGGYLANAQAFGLPWANSTINVCPGSATSPQAVTGSSTNCTPVSTPATPVIFMAVVQTPAGTKPAVAAQIASLLPNGTVPNYSSCGNGSEKCSVVSYVNTPAAAAVNISAVQHITTVLSLPFYKPADPSMANQTAVGCVAGAPASGAPCWPPPASGDPQVKVPPECSSFVIGTTGYRPVIYTSVQGVASPAAGTTATGTMILPPLSAFYVIPVGRYDSGRTKLLGWDIYTMTITNTGPAATSNQGAYVTVITKCINTDELQGNTLIN